VATLLRPEIGLVVFESVQLKAIHASLLGQIDVAFRRESLTSGNSVMGTENVVRPIRAARESAGDKKKKHNKRNRAN
jgi:hypothetical protein